MPAADRALPVSAAEADALFADLAQSPGLVLAVSGGPDSTALLVLIARWHARLKRAPRLTAVTVDHGLRPESRREAAAVKRLARRLGVSHRTVRWNGKKPATRIQEAAREARYRLLAAEARRIGAPHVLTAHTLDDQAETVLFRLSRGTGLTGLGAMARVFPLPAAGESRILLVRPLLSVPKLRLVATLRAARIDSVDDPSNRDPRFSRSRLRDLMPALAREGLGAERWALLAARARRAEQALAWATQAIAERMPAQRERAPVVFSAEDFQRWPPEIMLRLLRQAIESVGEEGPVELGKLEALLDALRSAGRVEALGTGRIRRTLAGAVVTADGDGLTVSAAPARRFVRRSRSARDASVRSR